MHADRELNAAMRATWPQLPPDLRKTAANIATIRMGIIAYAFALPVSIVNTAAKSTPAEFASYLLTMTPMLGVIGLVAAIAILYVRAVRTAPTFVAAYMDIMPGYADRIEAQYSTPGLGDIVAPWIRARRNIFMAALERLGSRFGVRP